mgnify:CR=1 FL=1
MTEVRFPFASQRMEFAHQQGGAGSGKTGQPKSSAKRVNEADYSTKDAVSFPRATTRTHENAAFEIDHYTSDACPNIKFHELLKKVLKTHRVHSMRGFLNALHSSNLVLQSKTEVFRLITGKGSSLSADELRATMLRHAKTDPAWMLKYGPAGDLPSCTGTAIYSCTGTAICSQIENAGIRTYAGNLILTHVQVLRYY